MSVTLMLPNTMNWAIPYVDSAMRPVRIVLGAWGLAYDGVSGVVRDPALALETVTRRGLRVEHDLETEFRHQKKRGNFEIKRLSGLAHGSWNPVKWIQAGFSETGHLAEDELERQIVRVLQHMGIPSRDRLDRLSMEIENLSAKIDQELLLISNDDRVSA